MEISMSQDIMKEVYFLLGSVLMGIIVTFGYDFILIWRRLVKHKLFFVSVEDFIFWVICAVLVFYMLYEENNGILRWFAVLGAAVGMWFYKKIVGFYFVRIMSTIIQKEISVLKKIFKVIFMPIHWLVTKIRTIFVFFLKKGKKIGKYAKKKLTVFIKMLRITLCKR